MCHYLVIPAQVYWSGFELAFHNPVYVVRRMHEDTEERQRHLQITVVNPYSANHSEILAISSSVGLSTCGMVSFLPTAANFDLAME